MHDKTTSLRQSPQVTGEHVCKKVVQKEQSKGKITDDVLKDKLSLYVFNINL